MSTTKATINQSSELLRATEAATNWRALAMTALGAVSIMVMFYLTAAMFRTSAALGFMTALIALVVCLVAYSSVGILLMRQAQGREIGFGDAIMQAVMTVHRLVGFAFMLLLIYLGIALAAMVVLFVCKIPGVGPMLYAILFPALTVVFGVVIAGMLYVVFPLAAPAIWEGNTVFQTIARMSVIIRKQLVAVIVRLMILGILVFVVSCVVWLILVSGYVAITGLSTALGINPLGGMLDGMQGLFGGQFGHHGYNPYANPYASQMGGQFGDSGALEESLQAASRYSGAFAFGSGLLVAIGMTIPMLTYINGSCLVYLQSVAGLDFDEEEQKLRAHVDEAKRRAQEARDNATARMQTAPAGAAAARHCTACHAPLAADDTFCGECGARN